jgi:hypothetical protein
MTRQSIAPLSRYRTLAFTSSHVCVDEENAAETHVLMMSFVHRRQWIEMLDDGIFDGAFSESGVILSYVVDAYSASAAALPLRFAYCV